MLISEVLLNDKAGLSQKRVVRRSHTEEVAWRLEKHIGVIWDQSKA